MGLMDKFKNLFTDEEIIEEDDVDTVEIKEIKKEETVNKLPTFMREKIEKEEKKHNLKLDDDDDNNTFEAKKIEQELELPKIEEKNTFKFPMDLEDSDFIETRSRQSVHQRKQEEDKVQDMQSSKEKTNINKQAKTEPKVADLYKDKKVEKIDNKPKFRATPIISPIYGVLDKNYTPGDIEQKTGNNFEEKRSSKIVDFDSVRKKAYGSLTKDIKENLMCENCEYMKEAKECKKEKVKEKGYSRQYSYEILEESENAHSDLTLDQATENYYDYGVEYERKPESCKNTYKEEVKISNFEDEKPKKEIPPVKSSINLLSTLKKSMGDNIEESNSKNGENLELTDDLFNLIDSMYDERNENKW